MATSLQDGWLRARLFFWDARLTLMFPETAMPSLATLKVMLVVTREGLVSVAVEIRSPGVARPFF